MKIQKITPINHPYLLPLSYIPDPPRVLFFKGELPKSRRPTVAIVGTRKPTSYGREVTQMLASDLAQKGVVIVSGLALGIDAISHQSALDAGGTTIAVLANSVDQIYPRTNYRLGQAILQNGGAIISEYEPPTDARDFQFLARNRIVSGMADAVIVVEAASRSGTLATAAHALSQGRDVFAVPGLITSALSRGCHHLIKQGAQPVTCANDILECIAPDLQEKQMILPLGATPMQARIIEQLVQGVNDGEMIRQILHINLDEFQQTLTLMELDGTIRPLGGNRWTLKR